MTSPDVSFYVRAGQLEFLIRSLTVMFVHIKCWCHLA